MKYEMTPEQIIDYVYSRRNDEVHGVLEMARSRRFDPLEYLESQLEEDELTDKLYEKDQDGFIVFPVKVKGKTIRPYVGHIGDQTCMYHAENIKEHLILMLGGLWETGACEEMLLAGLLHDAGKKYSAGTNQRGELCFYGHEYLSAFYAAEVFRQLGFTKEEALPYIKTVYYHMAPFGWKDDLSFKMFETEHGGSVAANVAMMNRNDIGARSRDELETKYRNRLMHGYEAVNHLDKVYSL